ncbi:hypothetical protein ACQ86B_08720 [Mycolicibacterium aichiense]|uniref:hypothetical protein n=1 Tax=Mycolicibacterium aichiense TaxID=1799 RepID=UPI003D66476F
MSMPGMDYNQQLLSYLQYWRQLLEQWTAIAAGAPFLSGSPTPPTALAGGQFMPPVALFMPPPMPVMPSTPYGPPSAASSPTTPAPGDYPQQLFGYLQTWRQYLEQATGAGSAPPEAGPAQQQQQRAGATSGGRSGAYRQDTRSSEGDPTAGIGVLQSDDRKNSGRIPPTLYDRAPSNYHQSQISGTNSDAFTVPFDGPQGPNEMPDPAALLARPEALRSQSEAFITPVSGGSAYVRAMNRVEHVPLQQVVRRSLYSNASAAAHEIGENPSL